MTQKLASIVCSVGILLSFRPAAQAYGPQRDEPLPSACTPAVNQRLQEMIRAQPRGYVENVMVCGVATRTTVNSGGRHGSHHLISLTVQLPNDGTTSVQIAINDALDGPVSAAPGAQVFAFGQAYITHGAWSAGIHDVHCSTHAAAENGWVVVNGVKTSASCPSR
jgi:hypothetical protein